MFITLAGYVTLASFDVAFALMARPVHNNVEAYILAPLKVQSPLPPRLRGFERYFSKWVPVVGSNADDARGVQVVATRSVPDGKAERVANVLAEYLDNDGDGAIDNLYVVQKMLRHGATMIMFKNFKELERSGFDGVPGFMSQDVEARETSRIKLHGRVTMADRIHGGRHVGAKADESFRCAHRPESICDAALEEVFHLVTDAGYGFAYPEFRTVPGTVLSNAMDTAIGDCGYNTAAMPSAKRADFRFPGCRGKYHYDDETCGYRCLVTEYFHHFVASYNGEYSWNDLAPQLCNAGHRRKWRAEEWELCVQSDLNRSRELLREFNPDGWNLITNPKFRIPLSMPTGLYQTRKGDTATHKGSGQARLTGTGTVRVEGVSDVGFAVTDFSWIALEGPERRGMRGAHAMLASSA